MSRLFFLFVCLVFDGLMRCPKQMRLAYKPEGFLLIAAQDKIVLMNYEH